MPALQLYGVDANVDEQLCTVRRGQRYRVSGLKHHIHRAVRRSNDASFGRLDCNARTENALCERGIGHVLQCYHLAGNRRRYLDAAVAAKQIFSLPNILLTTFLFRQYRMIE